MRTIGGLGKSNNRELGAKNPSSSDGECDQLKLQRHTTTVQCMSNYWKENQEEDVNKKHPINKLTQLQLHLFYNLDMCMWSSMIMPVNYLMGEADNMEDGEDISAEKSIVTCLFLINLHPWNLMQRDILFCQPTSSGYSRW